MNKAGIYFHIPFCRKKCPYCDFYSVPFEGELKSRYIDALEKSLYSIEGKPRADTVYFGGGTPSLLEKHDFVRLLSGVNAAFELQQNSEITAEVNPADCTPQLLSSLLDAGINRLSVGIQSMDNRFLAILGRRHSAHEAAKAIEAAKNVGFRNISADIMTALPNQSISQAVTDAKTIASLGVNHISAYLLKICHGTPFGLCPPVGLPNDDTEAEIYLAVCNVLKAEGFLHYEISNFCREGFESRHNMKYWQCDDYYAFGAAAAGCVNRVRYRYSPSVADYVKGVSPQNEGPVTAEDYILCSLRTAKGLSISRLSDRFSHSLSPSQMDFIKECEKNGYSRLEGDCFALTDKGFLVSNSIISRLI